jgi:hypothetical protein
LSDSTLNEKFVSAHSRALFAVSLLLVGALLDLSALAFHALSLFGAGPFSANAAVALGPGRGLNLGNLLIGLVGLLKLLVYAATIVAFLSWLHRAYKNLRAFAPKTDFTPGWVVGNWFIPFINLVLPYQAVKELWIKSDPAIDFSGGFADRGAGTRPSAHVGVWWFFWLASNVAGQVYFRLSNSGRGFRSEEASIAGIVSNALLIAAAVLAAAVVWTIDQMQAEKGGRLTLDLRSPPPPPASFDPPPYGTGV